MSNVDTTPAANEINHVLVSFLQQARQQGIITLTTTGNHQADSAINQKIIGDSLRAFTAGHPLFVENGLRFEVEPSPRHWYDFLIRSDDDTVWLPINLKVSSCLGRDDLSSKEGLFYAVTGIRPQDVQIRGWDNYFGQLASHVKLFGCAADYYYLVVDKSSIDSEQSVFWTSLLQLQRVHPNGNRPPFQCNWSENRERATWSRQRAIGNLLTALNATVELRAEARDSCHKYLGSLLGGLREGPSPCAPDSPQWIP
jgi:hypothetical protein